MMKAYVINLAAATERLAYMQQLLAGLGIPFERFNALDPEAASKHPAFHRVQPIWFRPWGRTEIACLLSHFEVWRLIADGPDEFGMVMEDDLILDPCLKKVFDGDSGLPSDADIVKIETGGYETVALSRQPAPASGLLSYHRLLSLHYGAGAYIVSRKAARRMVASTVPFNMPVDDMLFTPTHPLRRGFRVYQAVPAVAIQDINLPEGDRLAQLASVLEKDRFEQRQLSRFEHYTLKAIAGRMVPRCRKLYLRLFAISRLVPFGVPVILEDNLAGSAVHASDTHHNH